MEDRVEEKPNKRVDAGRGVVAHTNSDSNKNTTPNQGDRKDRPDHRARKAGH